ncbi:MAG: sugar phosphate isomerase/epimerase [Ruminococcaceae bacterium]|nr:sugar phosphate isomerase/epimerase [Oscillospiraceae bacterium]
MKLGTIIRFNTVEMEEKIRQVSELGFSHCQITCWDMSLYTEENAKRIREACEKYAVKISTLWCGWSGPTAWNFTEGPLVLGIVPVEYRFERMKDLMKGSDFAKLLGVDKIATHLGFLPENPTDPNYRPVLAAVRAIAKYCKANEQSFIFETGQETPTTLLRLIEDSEYDNLGINLDPANLIMYGKANPVDALDVFGKYVMDVHAKDGDYPTCGAKLGKEQPLGQGKVNFPVLVAKLKELGYDGTLIIEREIKGDEQIRDIKMAKDMLEELI